MSNKIGNSTEVTSLDIDNIKTLIKEQAQRELDMKHLMTYNYLLELLQKFEK